MFTIYGVPLSIHVRKVIVTALEKRLEHRVETGFPFDSAPGSRAPRPSRAVAAARAGGVCRAARPGSANAVPRSKSPGLERGDLALADSSVSVAYLEKRFPELP